MSASLIDLNDGFTRKLTRNQCRVLYSVDQFKNRWWDQNQHPFVFAQGDRTGYGFHGDFINGWDVDVLQRAAHECTALSGNVEDCSVFDGGLFTGDENQACRLPEAVDEQITGQMSSLPGCNQPTMGPDRAPIPSCNNLPISTPKQSFTDMTDLGFEYVGCGKDNLGSRTFSKDIYFDSQMTVSKCINYCKDRGYGLAGLEYASQCYCKLSSFEVVFAHHLWFTAGDNDYTNPAAAPTNGIFGRCAMACGGDGSETCGGPNALSIYQSCDGGACNNNLFTINGTASGPAARSLEKRQMRFATRDYEAGSY